MKMKRYRLALLILISAMIVVINFVTVPLFLYGAFGNDATLEFSRAGWFLNVLLMGWLFLVTPNLPLAGMLVSARQINQRYVYFHTLAFLGIIVSGLLFFNGEGRGMWLSSIVLSQTAALVSLVLLWKQLKNKKHASPAN